MDIHYFVNKTNSYFPEKAKETFNYYMAQASGMMGSMNSEECRNEIFLPYLACSLQADCIYADKGEKINCMKWQKATKHQCHRYDQAAITIIAGNYSAFVNLCQILKFGHFWTFFRLIFGKKIQIFKIGHKTTGSIRKDRIVVVGHHFLNALYYEYKAERYISKVAELHRLHDDDRQFQDRDLLEAREKLEKSGKIEKVFDLKEVDLKLDTEIEVVNKWV